MNTSQLFRSVVTTGALVLALAAARAASPAISAVSKPAPAVPNSECIDCHEAEFKARKRGQPKEWVGVRSELFGKSAHGEVACVECHTAIKEPEHPSKLPKVDCKSCHADAIAQFTGSIHGAPRRDGKPAATCATCHGDNIHELLPAKHLDSPVSKFNLLNTCAKCHEDEKQAAALGLKNHDAIRNFRDSIHGQGLYKMGLNVAPTCNDCHGVHDIRGRKDADAHTSKQNLSATCTACHVGVEKTFAASVHGKALAKHDEKAPVCTDCHSAHNIERPDSAHFKANSDQSCGRCHEDRLAN